MAAQADDGAKEAKKKRIRKRRIFFYSVVGCVLVFMFIGHYFFLKWPMGEGPAGAAVPHQPFEKHWSNRHVLLLGLGDSITEGFGASEGLSYFERLRANPSDEFPDMLGISLSSVFPNLTANNWAQSGSTSLDHQTSQIERFAVQSPDLFGIVAITTGGNDIIHNYGKTPPEEGAMYGATLEQARPWIENYEARLDSMLDQITAKFPGGCQIFLGNIYDPTDGVGTAYVIALPSWPDGLKVLAEYNRVIASVAERHDNVHVVDLHTLFMGHGITCKQFWRSTYHSDDPHHWYGAVFEDPNDRGYDAVRRAFLLRMLEVLPPLAATWETQAAD